MRLPSMILLCILVFAATAGSGTGKESTTRLNGTPDSDPQYGSGWLNLNPPVDFKQGDRLRLTIGGTAKRIVVRLLAQNQSAKTSAGAIPPPREVPAAPKERTVEVVLEENYSNIMQISVHGGNNLWDGTFNLGPDNGPATLISAVLIRGHK
jgi:hypothetical protein